MANIIEKPNFVTIADGLLFPEGGPIYLKDGSLILVEIAGGNLSRVWPDGKKVVIAHLGGGPYSSAVGPDGNIYITQSGGLVCNCYSPKPKKRYPL